MTKREIRDLRMAFSAAIAYEADVVEAHTLPPYYRDSFKGVRRIAILKIKRWRKLRDKLCAAKRGEG